jgi:predicted dehydrogenase
VSRRVVLAGAAGYGRTYLRELADLEARGLVDLAGVCEVHPLDREGLALVGDRPIDTDLARLLGATRPDIGIVATPIHTHVGMAHQVLDAGAHLLLEKPPAPSMAGWREVVARVEARTCQVGFQSLGSAAFTRLRELLRQGALGEIRGVGGWGAWSRTDAYYRRAPWAGRRSLGGHPVVDGVLTNPFGHAVATALALLDRTGTDDVATVELELFRARPIEADDTSCVRLRTSSGTTVVIAATLCAAAEAEPVLIVHGSQARAELHYTKDTLVLSGTPSSHARTTPLRNLLAHLDDPRRPLQSSLDDCGAFMRVVEAVRLASEPELIASRWLRRSGPADDMRIDLAGVEETVRAAAEQLSTFTELGVPWASRLREAG